MNHKLYKFRQNKRPLARIQLATLQVLHLQKEQQNKEDKIKTVANVGVQKVNHHF